MRYSTPRGRPWLPGGGRSRPLSACSDCFSCLREARWKTGREVRRGNGGGGSTRLWQCCSRGSKSPTALWTKIWKWETEEKEAYHLEAIAVVLKGSIVFLLLLPLASALDRFPYSTGTASVFSSSRGSSACGSTSLGSSSSLLGSWRRLGHPQRRWVFVSATCSHCSTSSRRGRDQCTEAGLAVAGGK